MNCISQTDSTRLHLIARKRDNHPAPTAAVVSVTVEFHPESPILWGQLCSQQPVVLVWAAGRREEGETGGTPPVHHHTGQLSAMVPAVGWGVTHLPSGHREREREIETLELRVAVRWPTSTSTTRPPRTTSTSTTTRGAGRRGLSHTGVPGQFLELVNSFDKNYQLSAVNSPQFLMCSLRHYMWRSRGQTSWLSRYRCYHELPAVWAYQHQLYHL